MPVSQYLVASVTALSFRKRSPSGPFKYVVYGGLCGQKGMASVSGIIELHDALGPGG
jgi:hypothetical protein